MRIRSILHKGVRRLVELDDPAGLQPAIVEKLRRMVSFLQGIADEQELLDVPVWRAHRLSGRRVGYWALHVTRNWRLTFRIDADEIEIVDLDFEDYH